MFHAENRKPVKGFPAKNVYLFLFIERNTAGKYLTFLSNAGADLEPDEFMNSKKSHEVHWMSQVVARLAQHCAVKQVE